MPEKYGVQPMSHRKFENMWCCRISIALEDSYFIVDASGLVDCFPSYEAAFSAGSRALITILNKRVIVPKKQVPKAHEVLPKLRPSGDPTIVFGMFDRYD